MTDISSQLIDQVKAAVSDKTPLKIVGSNSKKGILTRELSGQELLVGEHTGIVDYQPSELVLTARAGTPLSEIEAALAEKGQMLSCEIPHMGEGATIGGSLACNLSGPARPWGGSLRDLTLGVRLINGKGEHLRFGGQVMKNVAGYDGSRLQAGALGTLGVITEVSLKVVPHHEKTVTLVQEMSEQDAIIKMNELCRFPKPLFGAAWLDGRLFLRLSGAAKAVDGTVQQWEGDLFENDDALWEKIREVKFKDGPLWRFSVKSTTPPLNIGHYSVVDWAGSQRWVHGDFTIEEMEKIAQHAGGHVSLFKGGARNGEVRQALSDLQVKLQKRLKDAFDPHGIFNIGALYSWM